jgi:very-short-patch-repair endonuclease
VEVDEALARCGGLATRTDLDRLLSRREVEQALDVGALVRVARGRFAAPSVDAARRAAHRLSGVVVLESAALLHGWEVAVAPRVPHVAVPRNRKVAPAARPGVVLHHWHLPRDDVDDGVTGHDRTLVDCGRHLLLPDALAVFDSALRHGLTPQRLRTLARDVRGPGSRQVRQVAREADEAAANAFESAPRGIALDVPGLRVRPQVPLWGGEFLGRPDLVDDELRIVVEADSHTWHGDRAAFDGDARRYNRLAVHGWLVLRFTWEDVMLDRRYVAEMLAAAVAERTQRVVELRRPA